MQAVFCPNKLDPEEVIFMVPVTEGGFIVADWLIDWLNFISQHWLIDWLNFISQHWLIDETLFLNSGDISTKADSHICHWYSTANNQDILSEILW